MFRLKQLLKMLLQNYLLPLVYRWYARRPVDADSIVFADAHHAQMPFSMRRMYESLRQDPSYRDHIQCFICDFSRLSWPDLARYLIRFMRAYAAAGTVFICDYYLPVASCQKRPQTRVVQLWHSCGLMKKIAYDAPDDIPRGYKGDMFGNYSLLTLSSEACVPVHEHALRLPKERIRALGVSRTDVYFDREWKDACRDRFYERYPQAAGKKIILWAPTFRGNAADPSLTGLESVRQAQTLLGEKWYLIIKAHPHIDAKNPVSNCTLPTEELLDLADVLVTDYSSVLFDYLLFEKPAVLFAPDLEEYEQKRGFYIDYRTLPFPLAKDAQTLARAVQSSMTEWEKYAPAVHALRVRYCGACDGNATERIRKEVGLL